MLAVVSFSACTHKINVNDELIIKQTPQQGWSGDFENGVASYNSYNESEYEDDEAVAGMCYSFEFENGVCKDAIYNIILTNKSFAILLEKMLNNGNWDMEEDSGELFPSATRSQNNTIINYDVVEKLRQIVFSHANTRSAYDHTLSFNVSRKDNVIFVKLDNFKGKSANDVKYTIDVWEGKITVPNRFMFGKWDSAAGRYTCKNLYALGIDYQVDITFNGNRIVQTYTTKMTMPTTIWAEVMYESLVQSADQYIAMFGKAPQIKREGRDIYVEAIILAEISEEEIVKYLILLDYANNVPIIANIF